MTTYLIIGQHGYAPQKVKADSFCVVNGALLFLVENQPTAAYADGTWRRCEVVA